VTPEAEFLAKVVEHGIVSADECRELSTRYQGDTFSLLIHLVQRFPNQRDELGKLWGNSLHVAYVDPGKTFVQFDLCQKLPEALAKNRKIFPLYEFGGVVTLAMATPTDRLIIDQAEGHLDMFVSPVFSFPDQIGSALDIGYQTNVALEKLAATQAPILGARTGAMIGADELRKLSDDKTIITFTSGLVLLALKQRASDIHIEPLAKSVRIRFRIDGVLQEVFSLSPALLPPIVIRLKILAEADISETRRPQDGRISFPLSDRTLDIRFSTVPTINGEKIVMRLLGQAHFSDIPDLDELDFSKKILDSIKRLVEYPNGIFFVTGPTGSGKTTTLYALLKFMNHPGVNILTIEDPVEYTLDGINQVGVNEASGLTFAPALRHFMRQDPDIILVGEIRDLETAAIAARAALTGHLVLTTMHTNTSLQAIIRMLDLGVDPGLVAPSIVATMAQRLVRRLCSHCKETFLADTALIDEYFEWDGKTPVSLCRPKGCVRCNNTGYLGRVAIHELFLINDEVRSLVSNHAPAIEIEAAALATGYETMRYDGFKKVLRGLTTIEEVNRVVLDD
jgi:type IV pilus assembly protein PilB